MRPGYKRGQKAGGPGAGSSTAGSSAASSPASRGRLRSAADSVPVHTSDSPPDPAPEPLVTAPSDSITRPVAALRPVYFRLPDHVSKMLKQPFSRIHASEPDAVERLQKRLAILENGRQFGGSLALELRIQHVHSLLDHAEAIRATPETIERHGDVVIHENPATGRVEITFPAKYDQSAFKTLRAFGYFPKAGNAAYRLRKIVNGVNVALEAARQAVAAVTEG